jgi:hypothetical protein
MTKCAHASYMPRGELPTGPDGKGKPAPHALCFDCHSVVPLTAAMEKAMAAHLTELEKQRAGD